MGQEKNPKVVLDTNIFISSIFWKGNPHKIVELALDREIQVFTSIEILNELEKVLKEKFKQEREFIDEQIALIIEYVEIISPKNKVDIVKEDPDDNKIIECAITAEAGYIISGDPHLTKIKEVFGVKILKPAEFLELL